MSAYADFVWDTVRSGNPARIARQKAIEEQIVKPFRFSASVRTDRRAGSCRTFMAAHKAGMAS